MTNTPALIGTRVTLIDKDEKLVLFEILLGYIFNICDIHFVSCATFKPEGWWGIPR